MKILALFIGILTLSSLTLNMRLTKNTEGKNNESTSVLNKEKAENENKDQQILLSSAVFYFILLF